MSETIKRETVEMLADKATKLLMIVHVLLRRAGGEIVIPIREFEAVNLDLSVESIMDENLNFTVREINENAVH